MVNMMIENAGCPKIGLMTTRSNPTPSSVMTMTVAIAAAQKGRPMADIAMKPPKAPSIIRSPCAKVTVSVAL